MKLQWVRTQIRKWWVWIVIFFVLVGIGSLASGDAQPAQPFAPNSVAADGTKALSLLLEKFDGRFEERALPTGDAAIQFQSGITDSEANNVRRWVRTGGTLILTSPDSRLSDLSTGGENVLVQRNELSPSCTSPFVSGVNAIQPAKDAQYNVYKANSEDVSCFPSNKGAFMVIERYGLGTVVNLGSPDLFTNSRIGKADNSVLAMNLLHGGTVTILRTETTAADGSSGDRTLSDLIPDRVREAIGQFAIALILVGIWRSRRLGKPVVEDQLVDIAGSQLVVAVGNLLQTARRTDGAAAIIRRDLRRSLADLFGLPPDVDPELLAATVSARTGLAQGRLLTVLVDRPLADGKELILLTQQIEAVHREVANVR